MTVYTDYCFKFALADLPVALTGFPALRAAGLLPAGERVPENMLGTPRDAQGAAVSLPSAAWKGDPGVAASSYTDPDTQQVVQVPARGDPTQYYIAIRATVTPAAVAAAGVDPASYRLVVCDPAENASVLGVWA